MQLDGELPGLGRGGGPVLRRQETDARANVALGDGEGAGPPRLAAGIQEQPADDAALRGRRDQLPGLQVLLRCLPCKPAIRHRTGRTEPAGDVEMAALARGLIVESIGRMLHAVVTKTQAGVGLGAAECHRCRGDEHPFFHRGPQPLDEVRRLRVRRQRERSQAELAPQAGGGRERVGGGSGQASQVRPQPFDHACPVAGRRDAALVPPPTATVRVGPQRAFAVPGVEQRLGEQWIATTGGHDDIGQRPHVGDRHVERVGQEGLEIGGPQALEREDGRRSARRYRLPQEQ